MQDPYQDYFAFLDKLGGVFDKLTAIAKEKTAAVRRDDLLGVQDCMKREQAMSLQLRSMDKQREQHLQRLGLTGVPLSGLAEHCPDNVRREALAAQKKLMDRYNIYRSASEAARSTLEINLHEFERFIAEDARAAGGSGMADIRA